MSLEGRVAIVTGGGRGIGRSICLGLAADGAAVAVNYHRDAESAQATVDEIVAAGGRAKAYQAAVESIDDDRAMVDAVIADFGKVDILVNNAGIASRGQSVRDTDPAEMERVVGTHAFGSFYMSQLVLDSMRQQERGDIVMISSVAASSFGPNGSPYNMGKGALEALAFTLAKEERRNGIHVNIVAPGLTETQMGIRLARATRGTQSRENLRELDAKMPYGHVCQPEEIADVVRFLVSEQSTYVTGQRIQVDGGGPMMGAY